MTNQFGPTTVAHTCGDRSSGTDATASDRAIDSTSAVTVAALYCFAPFGDPAPIAAEAERVATAADVKGTLIFAAEGINGTIAGSVAGIALITRHIRALPGCERLSIKYSTATAMPFGRLKVKLKREIVTMGVEGIDPTNVVGTYLSPAEWNKLISDPDTILIDTRNDYEVSIGTFAGAINPGTRTFREFPDWAAHNLVPGDTRPIAMFCTGGIRCEKATALLKERGFANVFHLEGGVLRYLEEMPTEHSRWQGDCFVFDERVSVGNGLSPGRHKLCRECGRAVAVDGRGGGYLDGPCLCSARGSVD